MVGIERQHELVEVARERLKRLGYDNVEIVEGDGTKGWPTHAPFDAILAAASGSHVPEALIAQLAPGGRLVMPVGEPGWVQELVKVTKRDGRRAQAGESGRGALCAADRRRRLERALGGTSVFRLSAFAFSREARRSWRVRGRIADLLDVGLAVEQADTLFASSPLRGRARTARSSRPSLPSHRTPWPSRRNPGS